MNTIEEELKRLSFEDILWGIFIILSILNIFCNKLQKDYVVTNDEYYENVAGNISKCVLSILFLIYVYFFFRNYNMYNNKDYPTNADFVKVMGSLFFIIGTLCLLYFQVHSDDNFIDDVM